VRKTLINLTVAALAIGALAGCGGKADAAQVTTLRYQGNVGAVTLPELAADLGYLGNVKLKWIGNSISGPQDIQAATTGDTDFGGAFNGAIIKLAAAKAPIKAVISYYGVDAKTYTGFYVLKDSPIKTAKDLIGRKIGVNTLGAHSEAVIKTYLSKAGLTDAEIKKVELTVVPPVSTEQSLRQKQIDVGALGGALRDKALDRGGIRPLFSDYQLFGKFSAGSYVFRKDFIAKNPKTVRTFVAGIAKTIEWTKHTPRKQVIARLSAIIAKRHRNEDDTQTRYWQSYGIAGKGGVIAEREFTNWVDWLQRAGELKGKQVDAKEIYTNEFNPYQGKS